MIKKKDVLTMRIPFPDVDSKLARIGHMYICLDNKNPKEFLKCQTERPYLARPNSPPYQYIKTMPDIQHNPFRVPTFVDCDKSFIMDHDIVISEKLLATRRRDVSKELFKELKEKIKHQDFKKIELDASTVAQLNDKIELME